MMMLDVKKAIERAVKNIQFISKGVITSVQKKGKVFVTTQDDEIRDIEVISSYGLHSLPLNKNIAHVVFSNTAKTPLLLGIKQNSTPIKLEIGETLLYNQKVGTFIHLKNDGKIYYKGELVEVK